MSDYFSTAFTLTHGTPVLLVDVSTKDREVYLTFPVQNAPATTIGFTSTSLIGTFVGPFMIPAGEQLWADGATGNTVHVFATKSISSTSLCN